MGVQAVEGLVAVIFAAGAVAFVVTGRVSTGSSSAGIWETLRADAGATRVSHVGKAVVRKVTTRGHFALKALASTVYTWCRLGVSNSSRGSCKGSALQTRSGGRLDGSGIIAAVTTAVVVVVVGPRVVVVVVG